MIDLSRLNKEQLEAATHINGPMLVLAGAGTGKTATMTHRAGYLIDQGIAPEKILMLTFTNKAAREMKERLIKMLEEGVGDRTTACTFHSFCAMMLRIHGHHIGISPHFTILGPGEDEDVIAIVKTTKDKTRYKGKGFPPNSKVCDLISISINKGLDLEDIMEDTKYANFVEEVKELQEMSAEYRKKNDMLNYDDVLVRFIDLLCEKPNIARMIANTYQYIMVDEYQDTNPLQEVILLELFKYTKNIAVVGDDMQSLYGFRGAVVDNIIHFPNKFEGCKRVDLIQNYRSSQEILDLANNVCTWATEGFPKELIGTHHSEIMPSVVSVADQYEETTYVVNLVKKLHESGIPLSEICIVERNSISSAGIEVALNREGLSFDKYGGMKYTDLSYVKDILSYLKIMTNPYDEIAWFRILQIHKGIGQTYARRIAEKCRNNGFDALLDKSYAKKNYGPELIKLKEQLDFCDGLELVKMIEQFIDFYCDTNRKNIEEMDTDEGSRTQYLAENKKQREDLRKLVEIAGTYRSVDSFLDDLLLDNTKANENEIIEDHLIISTIHSVKGLEYQAVIMLDCINGIFPNADIEGSKEDNEELRCFYVAVTRAKSRLYLICPKAAMRYGKSIEGIPSRYLKESEPYVRTNDTRFFDRFIVRDRYDYYDDYSYQNNYWNRKRRY